MSDDHLQFTGERFTPECVREIWYEHIHRYAFAGEVVKGLKVCDAACGEGYGTALLRSYADSVVGVDIDQTSIEHARQRYGEGFYQASVTAMPFEDASFDVLVSFETIEHLSQQQAMLQEFCRVLKPNGFLIISSPDKRWYSDEHDYNNPHHIKELYREEFIELLQQYFPSIRLYGQKLLFQSVIWAESGTQETAAEDAIFQLHNGASINTSKQAGYPALYNMAICAQHQADLPSNAPGICLFGDKDESVYSHYNEQIRKNIQAGHDLMERDARLAKLKQELEQN